MLDYINHMTLKLLLNRVFGPKNDFHIICLVIFTISVHHFNYTAGSQQRFSYYMSYKIPVMIFTLPVLQDHIRDFLIICPTRFP